MMPNEARRRRGNETQHIVARYMQRNGFPFAESVGSFRTGSDITGTPGLAIEVKARKDFSPQSWVKQAAQQRGVPLVCFRPNGMGETSVDQWPCIMRLADLVRLLRLAGYGNPLDELIDAENSREAMP